MGKKTTAIFIALICFVSFSAFAEIEVPYVDIEDAQAKIKTLEDENTKLQSENEKLNQEISDMEGIITEEQKRVNQISLVIAKVQDQSGQLYESYPKIQDAATKKKAQDIIGKNNELKAKLEAQQKKSLGLVNQNTQKIASNRKKVEINTEIRSRNRDTINILNAAIEKTNTQNQTITEYINSVEDLVSEGESLIK